MKLFDQAERSHVRGRFHGEPMYAYLNGSNRRSIAAIRELLGEWFAEFTKEDKKDLCARLRSLEDETHLAAFFELYIYRLLICRGLKVSVHPTSNKSGKNTKPDFLIMDEQDNALCFLECTTTALSKKAIAANKRVATFLDVLNKVNSPNFYLDITQDGYPDSSPPAARLRKDLEKWLVGLDPDELTVTVSAEGYEAMPQYVWEHDGMTLKIIPIPKGPENRGINGEGAIGALMPESMSMVTCALELKKALTLKANYYGRLELPLIIAVNNVGGQFARHEHNMEALFGQEAVKVTRLCDGSIKQRTERLTNGAWRGPNGFRMKGVSAAIIVCGLNPFNIHSCQPTLYHHPCPEKPISQEAWPIPQYVLKENRMAALQGMAVADLLLLPPGFPPEDD